jgi:hypothetical protein
VSEPQPTGRRTRPMRQTVGDMIRSMVVVLAVVAAILIVTWRPKPDPVRTVDITQALVVAQSTADFTVEVPAIPDLRLTSARWEPTEASEGIPVWHLGYVTPADQYLQVSQSRAMGESFVAEQTAGGEPGDTVSIAGQEWRVFSAPERTSVVRVNDGVTTIVSGTDALDQVLTAAGTLRAGV